MNTLFRPWTMSPNQDGMGYVYHNPSSSCSRYHGGGGCACACACACAGGAGCSQKDFYGTKLEAEKIKEILK